MNQVYLVILGSVLALATSFMVEMYKDWRNLKNQRKNLKIILKLELKNTLQVIDKLIDRYGSISFYDVKILNQLGSSVSRLEMSREKIIFFKEDTKKEEVISCVNALSIFYSDLLALENQAFDKDKIKASPLEWNEDYYKGQRQIFATKSVDVKRRIQDILNYLEQ